MAREKIVVESGMPSSGAIKRFFGGAVEQATDYVQAQFPSVNDALGKAVQAAAPMVQNVTQALEPAQQIVTGAKSLLSDPLRYLSQAASKAIPAAIAASASLQYTGGQGSFSNFLQPINLRTKFFGVNGYRNAYIGGALYATRVLSTLTGYCKCSDVKLDLPGTSTEATATLEEQQIAVRYLESGFYIE